MSNEETVELSAADLLPADVLIDAAPEPEPGPLVLGAQLDGYTIEAEVGGGAMGVVYRARRDSDGARLAIKVLRPDWIASDEARERFEREARCGRMIDHPGIARVVAQGAVPKSAMSPAALVEAPADVPWPYLVFELVEGDGLRDEIFLRGRLEAEDALAIAREIARTLEAVHGAGMVHRDLKPEHLKVCHGPDGALRVRLLDFGLAQLPASEDTPRLTAAGTILGTPKYMAPEQWACQTVDHRADLYALGVVLYEMLCGQPPFEGPIADLLAKHQGELPRAPSRLASAAGIRPEVDDFVLKLLAKRADQRPATARDVAQALERLIYAGFQGPVHLARTTGKQKPTLPHTAPVVVRVLGQNRRRAGLLALGGLAAALAIVALWPRNRPEGIVVSRVTKPAVASVRVPPPAPVVPAPVAAPAPRIVVPAVIEPVAPAPAPVEAVAAAPAAVEETPAAAPSSETGDATTPARKPTAALARQARTKGRSAARVAAAPKPVPPPPVVAAPPPAGPKRDSFTGDPVMQQLANATKR